MVKGPHAAAVFHLVLPQVAILCHTVHVTQRANTSITQEAPTPTNTQQAVAYELLQVSSLAMMQASAPPRPYQQKQPPFLQHLPLHLLRQ